MGKQFIRGKPIRFGYKLFSLISSSGYLCHAEPYCGTGTNFVDTGLGLGANAVLGLISKYNVPMGSRIFFDNWFTSLNLLDRLTEIQINGIGTIRQDRCRNVIHHYQV